jgi:hypothetical protein
MGRIGFVRFTSFFNVFAFKEEIGFVSFRFVVFNTKKLVGASAIVF